MNRTENTLMSIVVVMMITLMSQVVDAQDSATANHIEWRYDLEKAKQIAASEEKLILMHFSASWCAPCKEIERFVFVNPMAIRAIGGQVVPVKIDVDLNQNIADQYNVTSVPYDVIITPAGHVIAERKSPRSTDGYLQMIKSSQEANGNLSEETVSNIRDLKKEMMRQKRAHRQANPQSESYGSLAASDTNRPKTNYKAPEGANVPTFEYPKPWTQTDITSMDPPGTDGVVRNKFASAPESFTPTTQLIDAPTGTAPVPPTSPAAMSVGQFVPANRLANTPPRMLESNNDFQPASTNKTDKQLVMNPHTPMQPAIDRTTGETPAPLRIFNPMVAQNQPEPAIEPTTAEKVASAATAIPETPAPKSDMQPNAKPNYLLGMEGYCGVTLMEQQKWVKGQPEWGCVHRGKLYLFASKELREQFKMSPDMYSPLLGGADPVGFHSDGELTAGKRKHGVFYGEDDGPTVVVLFSNAENRSRFEEDPAEYLRTVRQAMSRVDSDLLLR